MFAFFVMLQPAEASDPASVITVEQLEPILGTPGLVIIDVRSPEEYGDGHIAGAINVQMAEYADQNNPIAVMAATPEQMEAMLGSKGVGNESRIVIYDDQGASATRLWWVLYMYGHPDVKILDGGIEKWQAAGKPMTTVAPLVQAAQYKIDRSRINKGAVASTEEVLAAVENKSALLVDVRSSDEFNGKILKQGAFRKGHIPGSIWLEWTKNQNPDRTFKSIPELKKMYEGEGITDCKKIIVYCQTGTRSSYTYFVLTQLLGYPDVQNYDASWIGWSKDESLPAQVGYSVLKIGSRFYTEGGSEREMDVIPYLKDGRAFVPVLYLASMLDIVSEDIKWDPAGKAVTLVKAVYAQPT